jgi:hypothetical protein
MRRWRDCVDYVIIPQEMAERCEKQLRQRPPLAKRMLTLDATDRGPHAAGLADHGGAPCSSSSHRATFTNQAQEGGGQESHLSGSNSRHAIADRMMAPTMGRAVQIAIK